VSIGQGLLTLDFKPTGSSHWKPTPAVSPAWCSGIEEGNDFSGCWRWGLAHRHERMQYGGLYVVEGVWCRECMPGYFFGWLSWHLGQILSSGAACSERARRIKTRWSCLA